MPFADRMRNSSFLKIIDNTNKVIIFSKTECFIQICKPQYANVCLFEYCYFLFHRKYFQYTNKFIEYKYFTFMQSGNRNLNWTKITIHSTFGKYECSLIMLFTHSHWFNLERNITIYGFRYRPESNGCLYRKP